MSDALDFDLPESEIVSRTVRKNDLDLALCNELRIASVERLSSTSVRIHFSSPVIDHAALRALTTYAITPPLDVLAVTPEAVTEPTFVDLTTSEQVTSVLYQVGVLTVERA